MVGLLVSLVTSLLENPETQNAKIAKTKKMFFLYGKIFKINNF
jgi:hypothetical protein